MRKRNIDRRLVVSVVASATLLLTACSSGIGRPTAQPPTAARLALATESTVSAQVAAARQVVAKAEVVPTHIPLKTPLKATPPTGKTLIYLQCELAQCGTLSAEEAVATKAVGWHYKSLTFVSSNPATLITAMNQALQYHPVAVTFSGLPYVLWQAEVPIYQKAGVLLLPEALGPVPISPTVPVNVLGRAFATAEVKKVVAWITADSNDHANILSLDVPDYPILTELNDLLLPALKNHCSGCTVQTVNASIPQVDSGGIVPLLISSLQRDPSAKYLILDNGVFADGITSALSAAGLGGKIKVVAFGGDGISEAGLLAGGTDWAAATGLPLKYSAWQLVDVALRSVEGMAIPAEDGAVPSMLLTTQSMRAGHIQAAASFDYPADFRNEFKRLWKVK